MKPGSRSQSHNLAANKLLTILSVKDGSFAGTEIHKCTKFEAMSLDKGVEEIQPMMLLELNK